MDVTEPRPLHRNHFGSSVYVDKIIMVCWSYQLITLYHFTALDSSKLCAIACQKNNEIIYDLHKNVYFPSRSAGYFSANSVTMSKWRLISLLARSSSRSFTASKIAR